MQYQHPAQQITPALRNVLDSSLTFPVSDLGLESDQTVKGHYIRDPNLNWRPGS